MSETSFPISFTDTAIERFREVLARTPGAAGIRIGVVTGGCSGFEYHMKVDDPTDRDLVCEHDGVRVFVDPEVLPTLEGTTIDYVRSLTRDGFEFRNPKATRSCGCGESFAV